jgi:hypothetical protein
MNLLEEIKGIAFQDMEENLDFFLKEDVDSLLEAVSVEKMNKRIDKLVKVGTNKRIAGVQLFGKNIKKLFTQLEEVQGRLDKAKQDGDKEAIKKYKKQMKLLKTQTLSSYKTFKNGISSHRKTFVKFMFAMTSLVGMLLFIGVRNNRRNKYSLLMNSIKSDLKNNKQEFSIQDEKKIEAEFNKILSAQGETQ